jgi:hypothetical protein
MTKKIPVDRESQSIGIFFYPNGFLVVIQWIFSTPLQKASERGAGIAQKGPACTEARQPLYSKILSKIRERLPL